MLSLLTFLSVLISAEAAVIPMTAGQEPAVTLAPSRIEAGQLSLLRIETGRSGFPEGLAAGVGERKLKLFDCSRAQARAACAFLSLPFETPPGPLSVSVRWAAEGGERRREVRLQVKKPKPSVTRLRVRPKILHPTEEEERRIREEREEMKAAYAAAEPVPYWQAGFRLPVKGGITCRFGNRRTFNGETTSTHYGVDLRASTGTPVFSAADGKVVLAKDLYYAGNQVVVDHGAGVFSSYAHLSRIAVTRGQFVRKGDRLGLAGATGRVTGPHLHWAVRVSDLAVDPHQAIQVLNRVSLAKGSSLGVFTPQKSYTD